MGGIKTAVSYEIGASVNYGVAVEERAPRLSVVNFKSGQFLAGTCNASRTRLDKLTKKRDALSKKTSTLFIGFIYKIRVNSLNKQIVKETAVLSTLVERVNRMNSDHSYISAALSSAIGTEAYVSPEAKERLETEEREQRIESILNRPSVVGESTLGEEFQSQLDALAFSDED